MSRRGSILMLALLAAACSSPRPALGPSRADIEAMQKARVDQMMQQIQGQQDYMEGKDSEAARNYADQIQLRRAQADALQQQMQQDPRYQRYLQEARERAREQRRENPSGIDSEFKLSDQEEVEVGFGMVQYFLGSQHLLEDPGLQSYVNVVGNWVAQQSERPTLPWRFVALDSEVVNAFAVPGGYVFVTKGMLRMVRTESELAGVLGHEISHVVRKHHLRWIYMNKDLAAQMQRSEASIQKYNPAMAQQLHEMGKAIQKQIEAMSSGEMKANLSKAEEVEADRDGIVLAWRAGYEAWGLAAVLQRFEAANRLRQIAQSDAEDHPEPLQRFKYLDWVLRQRTDADNAGESGAGRYEQATRQLRETRS